MRSDMREGHITGDQTAGPDDSFELPFGEEFDPDSPAAAMARLQDRLRAIHPQASVIIAGYAALELEVDQVLKRFFTRPENMPRLSMEHRLCLLRSMLEDDWLDLVIDAVSAFGALRNSVAHGDNADVIKRTLDKLGNKTEKIGIPINKNTNLGSLAMHLASSIHVGTEFFEFAFKIR